MLHFPHFLEKSVQQAQELTLTDIVFREREDLHKNCNLAQGHLHSVTRKIIIV